MDLDLDVEGSMIEEVDLIIPWKALQTEVLLLCKFAEVLTPDIYSP